MLSSQLAASQLAERLPKPSLEKLLALQAAEDRLNAAYRQLDEQMPVVRDRAKLTAAKLAELQKLPERSPTFLHSSASIRYQAPGPARDASIAEMRNRIVGAAEKECTAAKAELARLQGEMDKIRAQSSATPSRCVSFLRGLPPEAKIQPFDGKLPKPNGSDPQKAVSQLRQRLADLQTERWELSSALYPMTDALSVMRAEITRLAALGRPDVGPCLAAKQPPIWPMARVLDIAGLPTLTQFGDGLALLCWLHKDALIDRLSQEITALADDRSALTDHQRKSRDAEIAAEILRLEREEEALVEAAQNNSILIQRRSDCSPVAVLALADNLMRWA